MHNCFYYNGKELNVIVDKNNIVWFLHKNLCDTLGYSRTTRFVYIPRSERSTIGKINVKTRLHNRPMIISGNVLRQILNGSKKSTAKDFKRWVKKEVMPTLRTNIHQYNKQQSESDSKNVEYENSSSDVLVNVSLELYFISQLKWYGETWAECCMNHKDLLVAAWKNSKLLSKVDCSENALVNLVINN